MYKTIGNKVIEVFWVKHNVGKPKAYFLYRNFPTHVRENWRNISGWHIHGLGRSFTLAVWL